jgi:hypothetical protein
LRTVVSSDVVDAFPGPAVPHFAALNAGYDPHASQ